MALNDSTAPQRKKEDGSIGVTDAGKFARRVFVDPESGLNVEATPGGLRNSGLHTVVSINETTWTALPPTALINRNAIAIQNNANFDIKINYSASIVGYEGMTVRSGEERTYDIKDTIIIYAKSEPGSGSFNIDIEELS